MLSIFREGQVLKKEKVEKKAIMELDMLKNHFY